MPAQTLDNPPRAAAPPWTCAMTGRPDDPFWELCVRALEGHQPSFTQLHQRLGGGLRNLFFQRSGKAELADDLTQKTWAAFWQALKTGKYDPSRAAVSTFLYAVGAKIWLQHLRSSRRAEKRVSDLVPIAELGGSTPTESLKLAELLQAVRECLAGAGGLSEDERWLVRSVSEGETDRQLAKRLNISPSTANARKRAAFEKVRLYLASRGHRADTSERDDLDE
jgi:RNA polymerase sigma factor (sigma-70 family)